MLSWNKDDLIIWKRVLDTCQCVSALCRWFMDWHSAVEWRVLDRVLRATVHSQSGIYFRQGTGVSVPSLCGIKVWKLVCILYLTYCTMHHSYACMHLVNVCDWQKCQSKPFTQICAVCVNLHWLAVCIICPSTSACFEYLSFINLCNLFTPLQK